MHTIHTCTLLHTCNIQCRTTSLEGRLHRLSSDDKGSTIFLLNAAGGLSSLEALFPCNVCRSISKSPFPARKICPEIYIKFSLHLGGRLTKLRKRGNLHTYTYIHTYIYPYIYTYIHTYISDMFHGLNMETYIGERIEHVILYFDEDPVGYEG